jgi:hypothetical protein
VDTRASFVDAPVSRAKTCTHVAQDGRLSREYMRASPERARVSCMYVHDCRRQPSGRVRYAWIRTISVAPPMGYPPSREYSLRGCMRRECVLRGQGPRSKLLLRLRETAEVQRTQRVKMFLGKLPANLPSASSAPLRFISLKKDREYGPGGLGCWGEATPR